MSGRDPYTGRFLPGHSGNELGRRPAAWQRELQQAYLKVTVDAISPEDWEAIIKRAIEDAKTGSHPNLARAFLARYILPSPEALVAVLQRQEEEIKIIVVFGDQDRQNVIDQTSYEVRNEQD